MTASTEYYVNLFKTCIMNHLYSSVPCSLEATYSELKKMIEERIGTNQEVENLEEAYNLVREEILGEKTVPSRT